MIVNELAKITGVAPHVVRYYTRIGLLKPQRNSFNGYKHFSHDDIQRMEFIRQAQEYGFTLSNIATVLDQYDTEGCASCKTMYKLLCQRVKEHRRRLEEMATLLRRMEEALNRWDTAGGAGCKGSPVCPAINCNSCPDRSLSL